MARSLQEFCLKNFWRIRHEVDCQRIKGMESPPLQNCLAILEGETSPKFPYRKKLY